MSGSRDEIIRMVNEIAAFFAPYSEAEAIEGIGQHIHDFWDPRMRRTLAEILAAGTPEFGERARKGAELALARGAPGVPAG